MKYWQDFEYSEEQNNRMKTDLEIQMDKQARYPFVNAYYKERLKNLDKKV